MTDLINILKTPATTSAAKLDLTAGLSQANNNLDKSLNNVLTTRAKFGTSLQEIDERVVAVFAHQAHVDVVGELAQCRLFRSRGRHDVDEVVDGAGARTGQHRERMVAHEELAR